MNAKIRGKQAEIRSGAAARAAWVGLEHGGQPELPDGRLPLVGWCWVLGLLGLAVGVVLIGRAVLWVAFGVWWVAGWPLRAARDARARWEARRWLARARSRPSEREAIQLLGAALNENEYLDVLSYLLEQGYTAGEIAYCELFLSRE